MTSQCDRLDLQTLNSPTLGDVDTRWRTLVAELLEVSTPAQLVVPGRNARQGSSRGTSTEIGPDPSRRSQDAELALEAHGVMLR